MCAQRYMLDEDEQLLLDQVAINTPAKTPRSILRRSIAVSGFRESESDEEECDNVPKSVRFSESDRTLAMTGVTPGTSRMLIKSGLWDGQEHDLEAELAKVVKVPLFDPDREPIQVYLRIRPPLSAEERSEEPCLQALGEQVVSLKVPEKSTTVKTGDKDVQTRFAFSRVFTGETTQETMYATTAHKLVENLFEGKNSLLFAYGITNSGKTHTIQGTASDPGILPRSLKTIFHSLEKSTASDAVAAAAGESDLSFVRAAPLPAGGSYEVYASYYEIYNEQVFDLLEDIPEDLPSDQVYRRKVLKMKEDRDGRVFVQGLKRIRLTCPEDGHAVLERGQRNRRVGETKIHEGSSRSHSIFTISLIKRLSDAPLTEKDFDSKKNISRLSIVDLAGSERSSKTDNRGARLKETGAINSSLMVLGQCMTKLRWNQHHPYAQQKVVPFRDSKLTRLFHDVMSDGRAVMIATVNVSPFYYEETFNSLKFTAVAKQVKTLTNPAKTPTRVNSYARRLESTTSVAAAGTAGNAENMVAMEELLEAQAHAAEMEERAAELEDMLTEAQTRYAALELNIRNEASEELDETLRQMEAEYKERLQREISAVEEKFDRKLVALARSSNDDRLAEVASRLEQNDRRMSELKANVAAQLKALSQELEVLRGSHERAEKQEDELDELKSDYTELQQRASVLQNACTRMEREHAEALASIESQLEHYKNSNHAFVLRIAELEAKIKQQDNTIAARDTELATANTRLSQLQQETATAKAELAAAKAAEESAKIDLAATMSVLETERESRQRLSDTLAAMAEAQEKTTKKPATTKAAVIQSQLPEAKQELAKQRIFRVPRDTQVVATPKKSDLMRSNSTPKVKQFEMVDVSPPHDGHNARVLLWKGDVRQSVSGAGVSVQFTDLEVLAKERLPKAPAAAFTENAVTATNDNGKRCVEETVPAASAPAAAVSSASKKKVRLSEEHVDIDLTPAAAAPAAHVSQAYIDGAEQHEEEEEHMKRKRGVRATRKRKSEEAAAAGPEPQPAVSEENAPATPAPAESIAMDGAVAVNEIEDSQATRAARGRKTTKRASQPAKSRKNASKASDSETEPATAQPEPVVLAVKPAVTGGVSIAALAAAAAQKLTTILPATQAAPTAESAAADNVVPATDKENTTEPAAGARRRKLFSAKRVTALDSPQDVLRTAAPSQTPIAKRTRGSKVAALPSTTTMKRMFT